MKTYPTWFEDQAYREGQNDAKRGRTDYERTPKSLTEEDTPDKAYWQGIEDYRKERERQRQNEQHWDEEYERWRNE